MRIQPAISSSVRPHPRHTPALASSVQTFTQGLWTGLAVGFSIEDIAHPAVQFGRTINGAARKTIGGKVAVVKFPRGKAAV
jgi:hypothetical protein